MPVRRSSKAVFSRVGSAPPVCLRSNLILSTAPIRSPRSGQTSRRRRRAHPVGRHINDKQRPRKRRWRSLRAVGIRGTQRPNGRRCATKVQKAGCRLLPVPRSHDRRRPDFSQYFETYESPRSVIRTPASMTCFTSRARRSTRRRMSRRSIVAQHHPGRSALSLVLWQHNMLYGLAMD
jgi:hypothetical protein